MSLFALRSLSISLLMAGCASQVGGGGPNDDHSDTSYPDGGSGQPPSPVQTICDQGLGSTGADLAKAMELCDGSLLSVDLQTVRGEQATVLSAYGQSYVPKAGSAMASIATGDTSSTADKDLSVYDVSTAHPSPSGDPGNGCGQADPPQVQDMVQMAMRLKAPPGATGFQFDFNFMSAEFPEYHCTEYDDTFLVMLNSQTLQGNISFDENHNVISINTGFFDVCNPANAATCTGAAELAGTGYDDRGGTGWLTTTAPISPNEEFSLTFYLFDEGDAELTSQVLIDNFKWTTEDVGDDPITID